MGTDFIYSYRFWLLPALLALAGCDIYEGNQYSEYVVVESHMIAGRDLPPVILSTTMPFDREYSFHEAALEDAAVTIYLMDETGSEPEQSFSYRMNRAGIYIAEPWISHKVQPRRTYRLEADIPSHGTVSAFTTVPDTFRVISPIPAFVTYQVDTLRIRISGSATPARQNVYIFQTLASDIRVRNMTPFYRNRVEDEDNVVEDFIDNPSPLINEANFTLYPDQSIELRYPWFGAAFYGENRIIANSLDRNLVDYIRSQDVQVGGSTLPPGEIPNAIYHIEGGIGVFGSISADTIATTIIPPPE